jgi:hypothetical protein
MKLDIHITTCHRHNVKCRERPHEGPGWNVRTWTQSERLCISKYSIESIIKFYKQIKNHGHDVSITLLDDGSDMPEALEWLKSLPINVKYFPARGSSAGINDHINAISDNPPDYVLHIEDDHILFNPLNIDFLPIIDRIRISHGKECIFTFRSGLPFSVEDKGFTGGWGPIGSNKIQEIECVFYPNIGNAHHLIKWETYKKFFPLQGSSGGCEYYMNTILPRIGINIEPQLNIHFFHSHMWSYPIPIPATTTQWHKSGEGFELGIKEMHEFLVAKNSISTVTWELFTKKQKIENLNKYDY